MNNKSFFKTNNHGNKIIVPKFAIFLFIAILFYKSSRAQVTTLTIHLRGVQNSKITLLQLEGTNALKPIATITNVKDGETTTVQINKKYLPGEFILRFDYIENITSTPYPSEKRIIINNQDIHLWVNPIFSNNIDSTWFQEDERENTIYIKFLKENVIKKEMLVLLQNFLLNYEDVHSSFYKEAIIEYEKRRKAYNQWISEQAKLYKEQFVSSLFGFQHVQQINWEGNKTDRKKSLRENYFDGIDFNNPQILKTSKMKEWMDGYVNLYGELATNIIMRDSLFTIAGNKAIERARKGNPLVYGWMVDYFFNGYETFNIEIGIQMLQPYLNDSNCLSSKRQAINRRLKGIETLVPGTIAPNINLRDMMKMPFDLKTYRSDRPYILLIFWSADCNHCIETVEKLYNLCQIMEEQNRLDVLAISLDETDSEIQIWQQKVNELKGWTHLHADEGINSKVAEDYYILGIPVMILINSQTKEIISLPDSTEQLDEFIKM